MSTKDYSTKQEENVSEFLGWKKVSASGARDFDKCDIVSDSWICDCKTHENSQSDIIFKKSDWDKLCVEADANLKSPVLIVDDGTQKLERTWCMFRRNSVPNQEDTVIEVMPGVYRTNIKFPHKWMLEEFMKDKQYHNYNDYLYSSNTFDEEVVICPIEEFSHIVGKY